jgi:acetyl-CoA carboxylase biotin carboxyl carrier protein
MHYDEIKQLIDLFEQTDLTEMELTRENTGLRLVRNISGNGVVQTVAPAGAVPSLSELEDIVATVQNGAKEAMAQNSASPAAPVEEKGTVITAPIVGTFYASAAPDKPPYVKVGDVVGEGDTLCIIEAMKFMNEVPSETGGTVTEILVQDGDFVEFGQPLFRIM